MDMNSFEDEIERYIQPLNAETNMNIYFEISIPNEGFQSNNQISNNELSNISGCGDICRAPLFQREYSRHSQTVEDIEKKLERASERRNSILQEVKERNENIVSKAMALAKQKLEKRQKASADLKSKLEHDLALKESRRKQIIGEKIETAKRKMGKVHEIKCSKKIDCCNKENSENCENNSQHHIHQLSTESNDNE